MLTITVPASELFDNETERFVYTDEVTLQLEHSLVALSKWESIYEKPFLGSGEKTTEEVMVYVQTMSLDGEIPHEILLRLSSENMEDISKYIDAKMTATWFNEATGASKGAETITSELIYYWLVALTIPFEVQSWHLNRLFTLIKITNLKNSPPKKMSSQEIHARNRRLNEQRKRELGTSG